MFYGTFHHTLDEKGRVAIPKDFRELLGSQSNIQVYVTPSVGRPPKSLDVYPVDEWEALADRIRARPQLDDDTEFLKRRYLGKARKLALDSQGRIVIPPDLRERIGLVKDAVFTGGLQKFLLWSHDAWQQQEMEDDEVDDRQVYKKLGL